MAFRLFYVATDEWHPNHLVRCNVNWVNPGRDVTRCDCDGSQDSSGLEQIKKYELRPERKCPIAQIISRSFRNYIEICWKASSHAFWIRDKNFLQRTKFEMLHISPLSQAQVVLMCWKIELDQRTQAGSGDIVQYGDRCVSIQFPRGG